MEKLSHLNESVSTGYFPAQKSYIEGTGHSDELMGSGVNDRINGNGGDDEIWGDQGNDLLIDADGNNTFYGGDAFDRMRGGTGADPLYGDAGRDLLDGRGGTATLWGGAGPDQFIFDLKAPGTIKIADFSVKDDQLINLRVGNAKEAYMDFMSHAHQDGRNVVYDEGETHLVLRYVKLGQLDMHNFADSGVALKPGLY